MRRNTWAAGIAVLALPSLAMADGTFGPSPYLSAADGPFVGIPFVSNTIETFEDGAAGPGVLISGGIVTTPSAATDSVDADDGAIDGSGTSGRSLLAIVFTVEILFDELTLGGLPTNVGFAWTDVGTVFSGTTGFGAVTAEFFGPNGSLVLSINSDVLGDGSVLGGTAEDRFFAAQWTPGISRVRITMANSADWEIDHLQYARLPGPGAAALAIAPAVLALRRRRGPGQALGAV